MSRPTCEACGSWKDVHWNDGAQVDLCDRCLEGLRATDKIAELESSLSAARAEVERLSRVEAAAKAWEKDWEECGAWRERDHGRYVARCIRAGIGPDGKKVKP